MNQSIVGASCVHLRWLFDVAVADCGLSLREKGRGRADYKLFTRDDDVLDKLVGELAGVKI